MTKQVIVVRMDLNMSVGKIAAQVSHASMAPLTRNGSFDENGFSNTFLYHIPAWKHWIENSFTKIVCRVESEKELLDVYNKAVKEELNCEMIIDNGTTEFNGVKTITCISIGPNFNEDIDAVTGDLKLLSLYPKKQKQ